MALLGSPPVFSNTYTLEHTPLLAHERQAAAGRAFHTLPRQLARLSNVSLHHTVL